MSKQCDWWYCPFKVFSACLPEFYIPAYPLIKNTSLVSIGIWRQSRDIFIRVGTKGGDFRIFAKIFLALHETICSIFRSKTFAKFSRKYIFRPTPSCYGWRAVSCSLVLIFGEELLFWLLLSALIEKSYVNTNFYLKY